MPKKRPLTKHHSLYGDIPLIERRTEWPSGHEVVWHDYDPSWQPPLPRGAVRGNVALQLLRPRDVPMYFYVDEPRTCIQCEQPFVFTAAEQKFWYEKLQFTASSIAIRCTPCRRKKRSESSLRYQMGKALETLKTKPDDPHALLDLAVATVRYRERTGEGDLNRAIAACRKVADAWPESAEPQFWEAKCQRLAGRDEKARAAFAEFVERARKVHRLAKLVAEAERELGNA